MLCPHFIKHKISCFSNYIHSAWLLLWSHDPTYISDHLKFPLFRRLRCIQTICRLWHEEELSPRFAPQHWAGSSGGWKCLSSAPWKSLQFVDDSDTRPLPLCSEAISLKCLSHTKCDSRRLSVVMRRHRGFENGNCHFQRFAAFFWFLNGSLKIPTWKVEKILKGVLTARETWGSFSLRF